MSVAVRSLLLITPLILIALWGSLHTPAPLPDSDDDMDDIELSTLPAVPRWALGRLPDFDAYYDVTEKKAAFFSYLYTRAVVVNARILLQREHLIALSQKAELTADEELWLARQAERLRVDEDTGSEQMFARLLKRLDTLPPSLVLAQAANESAWGTSRFARDGNNLFGQWCFSPGCGLVPLGRPDGASYEVARFESPYHSVRSYMQNLNRHPTYQKVRDLREQARRQNRSPTGTELAAGLIGYSERGQEYIEEIRSMIRFNNLRYYDQQYRDQVEDRRDPGILLQLASASEEELMPGYGE
ncbi:glucosaminidase domain-containing protein [uncultured Marinobacter sp.]|uniref:glucosaminidase domain-containing protein n=1 Tax=uncultured Marinobacter sp. TaxID=187379 RepID=UPI0030DA7E9F